MNRKVISRWAILALCFLCANMLVFAGGGSQRQAAGGRPTLQIGMSQNSAVDNYEDNYLTRYLENHFNINLDIMMFSQEIATQIPLMAASNSLPETIWWRFISRTMVFELGSNGLLIPLDSYFNDPSKTPSFNQIPAEHRRKMLGDTRSADGHVYTFPRFEEGVPWNTVTFQTWVNRTWLARLGLEVPITTSDLRNVLIAFRDRDPNGNGIRDEIGITGRFLGGSSLCPITNLINAFIYFNSQDSHGGYLALDSTGNTVISPIVQPTFRSALQYLNDLHNEGVLDPNIFTQSQADLFAILNSNPNIVGFLNQAHPNAFPNFNSIPALNNNPNFADFFPIIVPLTGPNGVSYTPHTEAVANPCTFISNNAKDVDLAVRFMDYFYDSDFFPTAWMGEENVDWTRDPAVIAETFNPMFAAGVSPGILGVRLSYNLANIRTKVWSVNHVYRPFHFNLGFVSSGIAPMTPSEFDEWRRTNTSVIQTDHYNHRRPQYLLPILPYNVNEATAMADIRVEVDQYFRQSIAEFVVGNRNINSDAEWNAYVREMDNIGLQQWIRLAQTAYNRIR